MIIGNCPVCGAEMRVGTDMTNADRIRSMTDEELAKLLDVWPECNLCQAYLETCDGPSKDKNCKERLLEWLKQEASE